MVASQTYDVVNHQIGVGQFNIALKIQEDPAQTVGRKPAMLPATVWTYFHNCGNAPPPPGIPIATIRRVDAFLDFSPAVPNPRSIPNFPTPQKLSLFDNRGHSYDECFLWSQEVESTSGHDVLLPIDGFDNNSQPSSFQTGADSTSEDETWESLDDDSPFSSQQPASSSSTMYTWAPSVDFGIDRSASISLLDLGFRGLFSSSKNSPIRHGQKPEVELTKTGLIDFAPSIFNPGYRTVSSQTCSPLHAYTRYNTTYARS